MPIPDAVGRILSRVFAMSARAVGLDRNRAFHPTVMIVIALICGLLAAMSGPTHTVLACAAWTVGQAALGSL